MKWVGTLIFGACGLVAPWLPGGPEGLRAFAYAVVMTIAGWFLGIGVERFRD